MDRSGSIQNARAYAVSESGHVFGEYDVTNPTYRTHGYWSRLDPNGTGMSLQEGDVPHPGFDDCFVRGAAMVGHDTVATGWVQPQHGTFNQDHGYTWTLAAPAIYTFQVPPAGPQHTHCFGINAMGMAAGLYGSVQTGGVLVPPEQTETAAPLLLAPLAGYAHAKARLVNLHSLAVGASSNSTTQRRATVWLPSTGTARGLDWLDPIYPDAQALGVNRNSHAVGSSAIYDPLSVQQSQTSPRAVYWASLAPVDLGVWSWHSGSEARAISDGIPGVVAEEVIGTSWDNHSGTNPDTRGFIWRDAVTGMQDLNAMISSFQGWTATQTVTILEATGINSLGEISAIGFVSPNYYHAVLLTPDFTAPRLGRLQAPFVGMATTIHATGFAPGVTVNLLYDVATGSYLMPGCPGTYMQIDPGNPANLLASVPADQRGRVEFRIMVPSVPFQTQIFLQAFELQGCGLSNLVPETIQ